MGSESISMDHKSTGNNGNKFQNWLVTFSVKPAFVIVFHFRFLLEWCRASPRSNIEAYCLYCEKHLKANRKSLINHALCKYHLDSKEKGARRGKKRVKTESITPDNDPLYDEGQLEDGEVYDDGSMEGTSFAHDDMSSFMVTEVDPPQMDSEDEDYEYEENGTTGFSVPSHIANGSSVSETLS